jgi:hypothetical protein
MAHRWTRATLLALSAALIAACGDDDGLGPGRQVDCNVSDAAGAISLGQTVSGQLTRNDCVLTDGTAADLYRFTLNQQRTIQIDMSSGSFDTFLFLFNGSGGVPIDENDDISLNNEDSRIVRTLPAGTYVIAATGFSSDDLGTYQLRVQ